MISSIAWIGDDLSGRLGSAGINKKGESMVEACACERYGSLELLKGFQASTWKPAGQAT